MAQAPKQSKYVEFKGELDPVEPAFVEFKGELDEEKSTKALQSATIGDNSKRKKKTDLVTVDNASWGDIAPDEEQATVKGTPVLSEQEKRGLDYATAKDYGNVVPRTGKYGAPVDTVLPPVERQDIQNTIQHTTDPAGRAVLQEQLTRPAEKRTPTLNANQVKNLPIEQQLEEGPFIENAPGVEATPGNIVTGLAKSLPQGLDAARQGIRGQFADAIGSEEMAADANREYQRIQSDVAASTPEIESPLFNAVYGGLASTLRQAPGMAAAIATRSAVPALAAAGLQTEAESYAKYKERGATGLQAAIGALGEGGIEVLTELTPMRFLVDRYGKTKASRLIAEFIAKDAAPEQVATLTQDAIDTAIANPDKTWGDYLAERPRAAFDTLIATVIQAGAIGGASAIAQRMQQRAGEINDTFATGKQAMADDAELSSIKAEADQINATAPGTVNTDAINAEIERRAGLGTLARAAETAVRETAKAAPVETLDTMDVLGNAGLEDKNVSDTNATAELAAGAIEQQPFVAEGGVPDIYGGAGGDTIYEGQSDSATTLEQGDGSDIALGNEGAAQDSPVTQEDEWVAYPLETGTKSVPRAEMPQIKAEHRGAMVNFLNARGITHEQDEVSPIDLKPTQAEFSTEKVRKAIDFKDGDRSILISSDGHVLDGHHQWMASLEKGDESIPVIRLNAPIEELLPTVKEFPSAQLEAGQPPANDEKPRRPVLPESYSIGPASAFTKPIGKTVYRETNGDGLDRIIMGSYSNNASGGDVFNGFVADNPDLAIGQGDNKGIKIQFRGDAVSGQEHSKPGTGDIAGREYKTDFIGMDAINQILVEGSPRIRGLTKRFLSQYFDSKKLPDGRTLFTRKGEEVGDPLDSIVDIKTEQSTPVDENIQPQIDAKAETESPVRPLVESLVKRRAAAQQINKEKIFDNVLAAAKDLMAGKPVKANKFKNWSVFFNADKQLRDIVMGLYEAANDTPEAAAARQQASAQASARAKAGKQIDTTKDNVLVAMAKLGGLKKDAAISEFGFDPADMKQHGAGIFRSFINSKNAKDLDSMREALAELGYPVGETVADFGNALSDAMGGFDVMAPEDIEAKSIAELEERYQQEYNELSEQEQSELDALVAEASALFGADKVSGIDAAIAAQLTGQPVAAAERKLMEVLREANRQAREIVAREGSQPAVDAADSQDAAGEPGQDSETGSAETGNAAEPESLTLTGQTEAEITADEKTKADQRKADDEAQQRAKVDTQVNDFTLTGSDRPADQAAARGAQDLFSQPPSQISDFGEKIGGAKKDLWGLYQDKVAAAKAEDIRAVPLSKSWPEPDYQKLLDEGADPWGVGFMRATREAIPTKPQKSYKQAAWADLVSTLRNLAFDYANGTMDAQKGKSVLNELSKNSRIIADINGRIELYEAVGHAQSLKGVRISSGSYSIFNGIEYNPAKTIWSVEKEAKATAFSNWPRQLAIGDTREQAIENFKRRYADLAIQEPAKKEVSFDIYSKRGEYGFFIGKKIGRNYIDLKKLDSLKEARSYRTDNYDELSTLLEKRKEIPDVRRESNEPRVGADMRNGQDVTPKLFSDTFGFRGVEFGNWVEGGKRQADLNEAFDGLMDMAAILGIPPRAISLNGELGLAFGARGSGGKRPAKAHYEPGYIVINLTKKNGAGSLGHEWWHALDNYFSRSRGKPSGYMTDSLDVSLAARGSEFIANTAVRKEMVQAFGEVMKSIRGTALKARSSQLDAKRTQQYWTTDIEMSARAFESYLISKLQDQGASNDYLANIVDEDTWKAASSLGFELDDSYPYPTAGEIPAIRAGFDHLFDTIQHKETESGIALFSRNQERELFKPQMHESFTKKLAEHVTAFSSGDKQKIRAAGNDPILISRTPVVLRQVLEENGSKPFKQSDFVVGQGSTLYLKANNTHGSSIHTGKIGMDVLNRLPELLADPVAIFKSSPAGEDARSFKVLIDATDEDGKPVVVAIKPNVAMQQLNDANVHLQATIFPTTWEQVRAWNKDGLLRYYNDKSPRASVAASNPREAGPESPEHTQGGFEFHRASKPASNPLGAGSETHAQDGFDANIGVLASKVKVMSKGEIEGLPTAAWSRDGAAQGMTFEEVQSQVDAIKAEWGNAPPVVVVTDMDDSNIPDAVRQENASQLSQGASGQPDGFFYKGKVYVVASEVSSPKHVAKVMFHEALGHFGLRGVYGKALGSILDDIYIARRAEVLKKAKEYGLDFNNAAQRRYASEEVLAEMAQTNPQLGFVKRAIAAIRTWLRKNIKAFRDLKLTDDEIIQNFLMPARDFVQRQGKQESDVGLVPAFSRQDQTTTPEFKKWFGDSKVVDADGKPLVVYRGEHGNNDGNPRSLLGSITFTDDPSVASTYAQVPNDMRTFSYAESPRVIPAFLSIKNPIINSIDDPFVDFSEIQAKLGSDAARRMARKHSDAIQNTGNWQENYSRNYASVDDLLDAKPEAIGDLYMDAYRLLDDFSFVREAKEAGFDGAIHVGTGESMDALEYRVFHENQIKSAMGNRGTFDSSNPDIRFSRTASQPGWQSPDASKMDNVIYALQDKNVDLKRVTKSIKDAGKEIENRWDAYLQEELYHGRTAKRVQDFIEQELDPLIEAMRKQDVTMADFEEYLWARHAEERNEQIAKINPDLPDGGSGMTTAEAKSYLAGLNAKTRKTYESLAKRVDAINHNSRQVLVDYGIESPETIAAWEGAYTHYVPLMREDMDTGFSGNGTGQGYSVKGNSSKRATGSQRAVVDILANIAQQREKNIIRGEKNRVSTALIGLAKLNENPDFWKVDEVPRTKQVVPGRTVYEIEFHGSKMHEATNLAAANAFVAYQGKPGYTIKPVKQGEQVMDVPDPNYKSRDNVIVARVPNKQGKIIEHAVVFNQFDERAMRMARSLKNLDQDQMGEILSMSASVTRYFASINTQYNPIFGMINILRDAQGSVLNLTSTPLAGKQAAVMAKTLPAMRGIYQNLRGKRKGNAIDTEWAREWEEFQKEGGQTGYRDMFRNARERGKAIEHALDPQWWAKTKAGKVLTAGGTLTPPVRILNDAAVKPLFNWLEDYNETFENAVRLAAYKTAKENGMSKQEAASLAKNISVNFNRKGEMGRQIGSLYAFFNASVQGTARIAETLKGPAGKRIIAGGVLLGVVQALALAAAGFGDDEPPEFVRDRSVILPIGDGKYLTFPLPLGFNVLPAVGRIITEWALDGGRDTGKRATHLIEVFMDMFNPIGNAGMSMQTLAPTTLDPLVALTENKDWTGRPIAKQDFNSLDPTPGFSRSRDKAWEASVQIAKAINWITGGTDFKPGAISPTADQLEYLAGQLTGGVGREAIKLGTTADALTTGENLPPHKVPLLGRFYGDASGQSAQGNQFYENLRKMHEHENEIVGRRKTGGDVAGYRSDNPEANLVSQAKLAEKVVGKLKKRRRMLVESGADREAIKAIDDRITDYMRRFNERVKGAREKEAA